MGHIDQAFQNVWPAPRPSLARWLARLPTVMSKGSHYNSDLLKRRLVFLLQEALPTKLNSYVVSPASEFQIKVVNTAF
jgi:hypothetical protein